MRMRTSTSLPVLQKSAGFLLPYSYQNIKLRPTPGVAELTHSLPHILAVPVASFYSPRFSSSTIDPEELNFRVRNGNGCILLGMNTTSSAKVRSNESLFSQYHRRKLHLLTKTTPYSYGSAQDITALSPTADQTRLLQEGYESLSWDWLRA